jgi:hypothetical protein
MRRVLAAVSIAAVFATATLIADSRKKSARARLSGYNETPSAVFTPATGEFRVRINPSDTELTYELEYSGLRGAVTMAHIHFGMPGTGGGVMIWLCGTATNPGPAGTPVCPQEGSVSRTVNASHVVGPAGQGIAAGDFAAALRVIRDGVTYANVHSTMWTGGEIRGQID